MTSSIQTNHLFFAYDEEDTLQDINITIEEKNGCILLAGTNGSGKSTLLNVLCGFLIPYRGTLERTMPIAYLPFESPLFPQLTVKENLRYFYRCYNGDDISFKMDAVMEVLNALHIDYLEQRLMKCSSGQKQKVAIAIILLSKAPIIFMDEPFVAIDAQSSAAAIDLIKQQSKERLFVITSHTLEATRSLITRLIHLVDGQIQVDTKDQKEITAYYQRTLENYL